MGNNIGFVILCMSLLYSIFLNILYFSKKHIKTYETKMFSIMMVCNLIGIILEFCCIFSIYFLGTANILVIIINRIFLLYLLLFAVLFGMYAAYIALIDGTEEVLSKKHNIIRVIALVTYIISGIMIIISPLNIYSNNGIMYSNGLAANIVYFITAICTLLCIVMMIVKYKNIKKKKTITLFAYIIGGAATALIQQMNPALTLATSMETFLIFLMYHTIENPDVKMIEKLEIARDQADNANRAKTDFLSSMSHEIRTPLNAIVGFSDYIMTAESLDEAKENAKDIVNASGTLLEIVNGILDISKIEAGKLEIVNSKYNARNTFESLAKLITPKMKEKGLDFTYYIAPDLPEALFGDYANIKKVVTNLLSNAYKYTEKGYVRYEVNCINSKDITKLIISVEDTGRGIKQENVDKLFTKFQRLEEDRNTTIEGTGLGLAITKQLIELMGGRIIVHTIYGKGSKFTVVLNQRVVYEKEKGVVFTIDENLNLENKKILIVDDNTLNQKVASKLLQKYNANDITCVDSGFDCLEKINNNEQYDVILLDDMMPKMSGIETLAKLREIEGFSTPVVALTANAISGMREKYLSEGFDSYLAKPIEKEELVKVLSTIFDKERAISLDISNQISESSPVLEKQDIIPVEDNNLELLEKTLKLKPIVREKIEVLDEKEFSNTDFSYDEKYLKENGIDLDKALELLGDIEMYNMTLNDFIAEIDDKWSRINEYKKLNDMSNYAIEVHSLKSDSKYLGFMTLADIAYQHELKSKENDSQYVENHFQELEIELDRILEVIKKYRESN